MPTANSFAGRNAGGILIAVALAALGAAAVLMPHTVLRIAPPCLVSLVLGDTCWGCGMTRAALAFARGDFAAAWHFNKLSLLVLPMLFALYARYLSSLWTATRQRLGRPSATSLGAQGQ